MPNSCYYVCSFTRNATKQLRLFDAESEKYPNTRDRWVDVRDVANAHIFAFENPSASGRYCLVGEVVHSSEAMEILRMLYPDHNLPKE